jgi:hypothetical protein
MHRGEWALRCRIECRTLYATGFLPIPRETDSEIGRHASERARTSPQAHSLGSGRGLAQGPSRPRLGHFTEERATRIHLPFKFDMRLIKFLLVSRIHLMSTGATQKPQERCFQGRGA